MTAPIPDVLPGIGLFLRTVAALRHLETGCPWDLAQDHASLLKYFHEELHEFAEALVESGPQSPRTWDELGDVLLQIGLHARLGEEKGYSSFDEIARQQAEKLIRRHPHVFDPRFPKFKTPEEVSANWEKIKAWAKAGADAGTPLLATPIANSTPKSTESQSFRGIQVASVPRSLPALLRASRIGEKAAAYRFDWPEARVVLDKIMEECEELRVDQDVDERAFEELGDLLFACAQYARKRGWDPEQVLDRANQKFTDRFAKMEKHIENQGLDWDRLDLAGLEKNWVAIK